MTLDGGWWSSSDTLGREEEEAYTRPVRDEEHTAPICRWAVTADIFLVEKQAKGLMGNS